MVERNKWLQVRVSEEEREIIDDLAADYGMDASTFIRSMVAYVDEVRPRLMIVPSGKELASAVTMP